MNFSVNYDGTTATFIYGNQTLTFDGADDQGLTEGERFPQGLDSLFVRLRADENAGRYGNNSIQLTNLQVNGDSYNGSLIANQNDGIEYLLITDITENFTLTGTATLSWDESEGLRFPNGSRLDLTVKAGYGGVDVPEPSTVLATLLSFGLGNILRRKTKA